MTDHEIRNKGGAPPFYGICGCFGLLALIVVAGVIGYFAMWGQAVSEILPPDRETDHLTDAQMMDLFKTHRSQLEKLVSLCEADRKSRRDVSVQINGSMFDSGVDSQRFGAYQSILQSLGVKGNGGVSAIRGDAIYVTLSTSGSYDLGSEKGFAYSRSALVDRREDGRGGGGTRTTFTSLGGHWFTFYSEKW